MKKAQRCRGPHRFHWHRFRTWEMWLSLLLIAAWIMVVTVVVPNVAWMIVAFLAYVPLIWVVLQLQRRVP